MSASNRQIRPKMMPKMPRKPTIHQLSAKTSLNASQRAATAAGVRGFFAVVAMRHFLRSVRMISQLLPLRGLRANRYAAHDEANLKAQNPNSCSCPQAPNDDFSSCRGHLGVSQGLTGVASPNREIGKIKLSAL